jgi:hypothetical protein
VKFPLIFNNPSTFFIFFGYTFSAVTIMDRGCKRCPFQSLEFLEWHVRPLIDSYNFQ